MMPADATLIAAEYAYDWYAVAQSDPDCSRFSSWHIVAFIDGGCAPSSRATDRGIVVKYVSTCSRWHSEVKILPHIVSDEESAGRSKHDSEADSAISLPSESNPYRGLVLHFSVELCYRVIIQWSLPTVVSPVCTTPGLTGPTERRRRVEYVCMYPSPRINQPMDGLTNLECRFPLPMQFPLPFCANERHNPSVREQILVNCRNAYCT